jgi:hypothetical protein
MSTGLKVTVGVFVVFFAIGFAVLFADPQSPETSPVSDEQEVASARGQNEPVRADVEIIDCLAKKTAPDWCSKVSYATDGERTGTLMAVVRSDTEGEIHWCSAGRREDGSRVYIGEAESRLDEQTVRDMGARLVTMVPRQGHQGDQGEVYFVLPAGAPAPESLGRCPLAD